ncbi:TPA: hypothetical protein HA318_05175 [Candidatus Micrarchaeota archaeon]|nr:MAG: hypothetical protein AUJ65_05155 [Candidatus Micrarchaeota archaeon CG1_02_51_15]HII39365.1 hypothetical protein [Candidatus Micrarchaeota archaeon]
MGKVMTVMKVFPQEETDLNALLEAVKAVKGCNSARIEDFVFGAKIIKASFICEDKEGVDYEEVVKKVQGVSEVQVDEVGLIS